MHTKEFGAKVKAVGQEDGLDSGQFTALVSVFGNVDSMGDSIQPGAFKDDLVRWESKGDPLPVIWSHDWMDPFSHIGHVVKAEETNAGLQVTGQMDMDNPKAEQVYRLLKGRRVTQFSFAYDIQDAGWGTKDGEEVFELRKLKVHEVGPCLIGANQDTELLAVKARSLADGTKAGRVLSQKNFERLQAAYDALGEVMNSASVEEEKTPPLDGEGLKTDEPSQVDEAAANDEEPDTAKLEEPQPKSAPRRALAVALISKLS